MAKPLLLLAASVAALALSACTVTAYGLHRALRH